MQDDRRQRTLTALREATENVLAAPSPPADTVGEDVRERARNAALRLLAVRDRSSRELSDRLRDKGFPPPLIEDLISALTSSKLLDDERFAHEWVVSRARHSARGVGVLRQELRHKGIADDIIEAELASLPPECEEDTARALLLRKVRTIAPSELSDRECYQKQYRRLYAMLARRGFPTELAQRVVADVLVEHRHAAATD